MVFAPRLGALYDAPTRAFSGYVAGRISAARKPGALEGRSRLLLRWLTNVPVTFRQGRILRPTQTGYSGWLAERDPSISGFLRLLELYPVDLHVLGVGKRDNQIMDAGRRL